MKTINTIIILLILMNIKLSAQAIGFGFVYADQFNATGISLSYKHPISEKIEASINALYFSSSDDYNHYEKGSFNNFFYELDYSAVIIRSKIPLTVGLRYIPFEGLVRPYIHFEIGIAKERSDEWDFHDYGRMINPIIKSHIGWYFCYNPQIGLIIKISNRINIDFGGGIFETTYKNNSSVFLLKLGCDFVL